MLGAVRGVLSIESARGLLLVGAAENSATTHKLKT